LFVLTRGNEILAPKIYLKGGREEGEKGRKRKGGKFSKSLP